MSKKSEKSRDQAIDSASHETDDATDRMYKAITDDFGDGIILSGEDALEKKRSVIPISPSIDIITSGGVQEGSFVGITGNEKTGKTTLALSFSANAQKPEFGNRKIFFGDVEHRLVYGRLKEIQGLRCERPWFNIIHSCKGKILSAEEHLEIYARILKQMENCVLIIDSISALCEEKVMTEGVGTETRGGGAKLFSQWLSMMQSVVPVNNNIVVGITHLISNTSGMGAMYMERAARRWKYAYDYHLRTVQTTAWKSGETEIGKIVKWKCNCSKLGPPGMQIDSYLRYKTGIDRLFELIAFGQAAGLITGKGWYTLSFLESEKNREHLDGKPAPKVQGGEKLYQLLVDNPVWASILNQEIMAVMSTIPTGDNS